MQQNPTYKKGLMNAEIIKSPDGQWIDTNCRYCYKAVPAEEKKETRQFSRAELAFWAAILFCIGIAGACWFFYVILDRCGGIGR